MNNWVTAKVFLAAWQNDSPCAVTLRSSIHGNDGYHTPAVILLLLRLFLRQTSGGQEAPACFETKIILHCTGKHFTLGVQTSRPGPVNSPYYSVHGSVKTLVHGHRICVSRLILAATYIRDINARHQFPGSLSIPYSPAIINFEKQVYSEQHHQTISSDRDGSYISHPPCWPKIQPL